MNAKKAVRAFLCLTVTLFLYQTAFAATVHFAQIADGGGWVTSVTLINNDVVSAGGALKFYTQAGQPRTITMNSVTASQFDVTIPVKGSVRYRSSGSGPTSSGWASFETSANVQGVAVFELRAPGTIQNTPAQAAAGVIGTTSGKKFVLPVEAGAISITALAVANTTGAPITVQIRLLDESGIEKANVLPPDLSPLMGLSQFSGFVSSLFPGLQLFGNDFRGTLVAEILGSGTFMATGLGFSSDFKTFWAIPVVYLTPSSSSGNLSPGVTNSVIFQDSRFCRFPGISRLPNGNLVVVYHCEVDDYGEGYDGGLYQKVSTDQGSSWSSETTIYSPPDGTGAIGSEISLLSNGTLITTWENHGPGNTYVLMMMKGTAGASNTISWGTPAQVSCSPGNSFSNGECYVSAKVLELANGTLMLPIYGTDNSNIHNAAVLTSTDGGMTWGNQATIAAGTSVHSYSEPNLVQLADGTIVAILRDDNEENGQTPVAYARAYSTDNGATWSSPSTVISSQHPGTPAVVLLGSGGLFLVTRGPWAGQTGYATSWDGGISWTSFAYVPGYATWGDVYDSVTMLSGGTVAAAVSWQVVDTTSATIHYVDFYDGNVFLAGLVRASQFAIGTKSARVTLF